MNISYGEAMTALDAATALSKIGSKEGSTIKRLAQILRWTKKAADGFNTRRELTLTAWTKKNEQGEMVVKVNDKNEQSADITNELEFAKELNKLLKDTVETDEQPPRAFTWAELSTFTTFPEADVIERLGPFVNLGE